MIESKTKTLDLDNNIGTVTLSDGVTVLNIPKLSTSKIIKIVKWIGVDGSKLYNQYVDIIADEEMDELEKFATILEELPEEQLVKIFSISLDLTQEQVLSLDHNEMLEVMIVYVDVLNLGKTRELVQTLYKKIYKKDLPDLKALIKGNSKVQQSIQESAIKN